MVTRGQGGLKMAFFAITSFLNGPFLRNIIRKEIVNQRYDATNIAKFPCSQIALIVLPRSVNFRENNAGL